MSSSVYDPLTMWSMNCSRPPVERGYSIRTEIRDPDIGFYVVVGGGGGGGGTKNFVTQNRKTAGGWY
jgi:hypothetical protein